MSQIFWVVITELPTKEESEQGELPKIIIQPKVVVARDDKDAAVKVALSTTFGQEVNKDRLEVHVRPF